MKIIDVTDQFVYVECTCEKPSHMAIYRYHPLPYDLGLPKCRNCGECPPKKIFQLIALLSL